MYEYGCQVCNSRFDRLRRMDEDDAGVTCPHCQSAQVQRQLSVFAAHSRGNSQARTEVAAPVASGGGCCGGGCGCGARAA
ncbi:MAG: hypothetical protein OHK0015_45630 [Chloroflexi bacterium OHK40]